MTSQYVTAEYLQKTLGVTDYIDKLTEMAFEACNYVDQQIKPFAEEVPLEPGSKFWQDATHMAALYARYLWYDYMKQGMARDAVLKSFEDKVKTMRESVRLEPTIRTTFRMKRTRFGRDRKVPFGQIGYGGGNLDYVG